MTVYFFDSSALAKLFVAEAGSQELVDLVETLDKEQKVISSLGPIEVHSAIRRPERAGELTERDAAEAIAILSAAIRGDVECVMDSAVTFRAKVMIDRYRLRALDAVQLASCCVASASVLATEVVFVASDKALLAAARREDFEVWDPAVPAASPLPKQQDIR